MATTTKKVQSFESMLEGLRKQEQEKRDLRIKLEDEARKAKTAEEEIGQEIQHMKAIRDMAKWTEGNTMTWYKKDWDAQYNRDVAWRYYWKLRTARLDVYITIQERTDMKKFKYEVVVNGTLTTFSDVSWKAGYRDPETIKKVTHTWKEIPNSGRYNNRWDYVPNDNYLDSTKKFAKLEEAEAFAEQWKVLIEEYYADIIKKERKLLKLVKKQA